MDKKLSIEEIDLLLKEGIDLLLKEGINSENLSSKEKLSKEEIKKLENLLMNKESFPSEDGDLVYNH